MRSFTDLKGIHCGERPQFERIPMHAEVPIAKEETYGGFFIAS